MVLQILLHLTNGQEDRNTALAEAALIPAHKFVKFKLRTVPTSSVSGAIPDLESSSVLCVETTAGISDVKLRCLRWAVHHRYQKLDKVHRQLRCDLVGGDENRLKRSKHKETRKAKG
jgi:hypothetical protein